MATFDSAYLLKMFNRYAGRPSTGDSITDADKYERLSEGQTRVMQDMYARVPNSLYPKVGYGSFPTLTTSDNQVFTFGTDANGYAIAPMGKTLILPSLSSFPDFAWIEGLDYVNEGTQIRLPNNRTWTQTLYWYGITPPADITASTQPGIFPAAFRDLIVYQAVMAISEEGNRNDALVNRMMGLYQQRFAEACLTWKTQFSDGGAFGSVSGLRIAEAGGALNGQNWSAL